MSEPLPPSSVRHFGWVLFLVALFSLMLHLALCHFFSFYPMVPETIDINPSNLWKYQYRFPPISLFVVYNWLGDSLSANGLHPWTLLADLPERVFFTAYMPVVALLALLSMTAVLRELGLHPWAAIFGGVTYAWQGDIVPFIFPAHFAYAMQASLFAFSVWAILRVHRTGLWPYALMSGLGCGLMVQALPDRGAIASTFMAGIYFAAMLRERRLEQMRKVRRLFLHLLICILTAFLIAVSALISLFNNQIEGVHLGGQSDPEATYELATQYRLPPNETLTIAIPGYYGWSNNDPVAPYWGRNGSSKDWDQKHVGTRNLNLAISTIGTLGSFFALIAFIVLIRPKTRKVFPVESADYALFFLVTGLIALVLSWGDHTPIYRLVYDHLPFMDKWRNPLKWLEITTFCLPVLSGFGLHFVLSTLGQPSPDNIAHQKFLRWIFCPGTIISWLFFLQSFPVTAFIMVRKLSTEGYGQDSILGIMSAMHFSSAFAAILVSLAWILLELAWKPEFLARAKIINPWFDYIWRQSVKASHLPLTFTLMLIFLSITQMGWVTWHFIFPVDLQLLAGSNPLLDTLRSEGDQVRVKVDVSDSTLSFLLQNQFYNMNISSLDISAASRYPDDLTKFFKTFEKNIPRLHYLAGVKNIVLPARSIAAFKNNPELTKNIVSITGYNLFTRDPKAEPSHALIALRDFAPKVTFIPYAEVFPTRDSMLNRLIAPDWDPKKTVLLDREFLDKYHQTINPALIAPQKGNDPASFHVDLRKYKPRNGQSSSVIEMNVQTSQPGFILINDHYDQDWDVHINGQKQTLLRADYLLRALAVPAGTSDISMIYFQRYHWGNYEFPVVVMNLFCDSLVVLLSLFCLVWMIVKMLFKKSRQHG